MQELRAGSARESHMSCLLHPLVKATKYHLNFYASPLGISPNTFLFFFWNMVPLNLHPSIWIYDTTSLLQPDTPLAELPFYLVSVRVFFFLFFRAAAPGIMSALFGFSIYFLFSQFLFLFYVCFPFFIVFCRTFFSLFPYFFVGFSSFYRFFLNIFLLFLFSLFSLRVHSQ